MPPHVLQFEAMWGSNKIASCAAWAQAEYAWLYGIGDVNGSFEMNLRVIWGKVAAIRKSLSIERLEQVFNEFCVNGLLFTWERDGKKYGHWTGSDQPGRLLPPALRKRYRPAAPPVPKNELRVYLKSLSQSQCNLIEVSGTGEGEGEGEGKESRASHAPALSAPGVCEQVVASWNETCSPLPEVLKLSSERRRKLLARIRSDEEYPSKLLAALQRAKQTPFLCGAGERGWKANFDWFIANDTNYVAVLEGKYDGGKGGLTRGEQRTLNNLRAAGFVQ